MYIIGLRLPVGRAPNFIFCSGIKKCLKPALTVSERELRLLSDQCDALGKPQKGEEESGLVLVMNLK